MNLFSSKQKDKETEPEELTVHVRGNGSRYVNPDEFFKTRGIRKLVEDLKEIDVKPSEKSGV